MTPRGIVGFAAWCVRRIAHLLTDERSVKALELAERYVAGEDVTKTALVEAANAAAYAADASASASANAAFYAVEAAFYADYASAHAVDAVAYAASRAASNATDAAPAAESRAQLEHLRELVKFEEEEAVK